MRETSSFEIELVLPVSFLTCTELGDEHAFSRGRVSDYLSWMQSNTETMTEPKHQQMLLPTVPPSAPKCWVEGPEEKGGPVSLRCKSSQGTTPISYTWSRETGGSMPPTATQSNKGNRLFSDWPVEKIRLTRVLLSFRLRERRAPDKQPHRGQRWKLRM